MEVQTVKKYVQCVGARLRSGAFFVGIAQEILTKFVVRYKIN